MNDESNSKESSCEFQGESRGVCAQGRRADLGASDKIWRVHATVIHRWKREALASMEAGFSGKHEKSHTEQAAHIHELHAKIGQLSVERDFLVDASNRLG